MTTICIAIDINGVHCTKNININRVDDAINRPYPYFRFSICENLVCNECGQNRSNTTLRHCYDRECKFELRLGPNT